MRLPNKIANLLVCLLLLPGFILVVDKSFIWFRYEAMGPLCFDASIFLVVGRAILNGFTVYLDVFENKPPGIFIISALSLYLTDSHLLGSFIEASTLVIYPFMMGWAAWRFSQQQEMQWYRILLSGAAMTFGSALAVYGLSESGQYEVESFGALFGMLYLVSATMPSVMTGWHIVLSGLLLLAAVGTKEPFFLTITGAMLVIYNNRPMELYQRFILPLMVTNIVGLSTLIALDMLVPYVKLYLLPSLPKPVAVESTGVAKLAPGSINGFINNHFSVWKRVFESLKPFYTLPIAIVMMLACALVRAFWYKLPLRQSVLAVICVLVACMLSIYTVTLRSFVYNHHYVFLVPLYIGLALAFIKDMSAGRPDKRIVFIVLLFVCSSAAMLSKQGYANEAWSYNSDKYMVNAVRQSAVSIDEIMDRCGMERYLNTASTPWGGHPAAFTKHTPHGPIVISMAKYLERNIRNRDGFMTALAGTNLILTKSPTKYALYDLKPYYEEIVSNEFTLDPPACARDVDTGVLNKLGYVLYYRKVLKKETMEN